MKILTFKYYAYATYKHNSALRNKPPCYIYEAPGHCSHVHNANGRVTNFCIDL